MDQFAGDPRVLPGTPVLPGHAGTGTGGPLLAANGHIRGRATGPHCSRRFQNPTAGVKSSPPPGRVGPLAIPHSANLLGTSGFPDEEGPLSSLS